MYDRKTDSYWPQTLGKAVLGPSTGKTIKKIPTDTVKWGDWKNKRIGRLIPPYSTRLQQRFGAFIQRIGLARIPAQAVPKKAKDAAARSDNVIAAPAQSG